MTEWIRWPHHAVLLAVGLVASCGGSPPPGSDVVARVNGQDIMAAALEEQYAMSVRGVGTPPHAEEADDIKLQILNEMITNEILLQLAEDYGLIAADAEVDVRFDEVRSQYSDTGFEDLIDGRGITEAEFRDELRTSVTIEKLLNMEVTSRISVSDDDIREFYDRNAESFNLPESLYLAHILITPTPEVGLNNLEDDDAESEEEAREKAGRLLDEIHAGADFGAIARRFSEDPSTVPMNGELGYQPLDAIAQLDPTLAEAVAGMDVGETYPRVIPTRFGLHILKLIDREPGGQKDLSDPRVENEIRQIIFNRRNQLLRGAYYEQVRNDAEVENYFAGRILDRAF
jgi:peptidyl-prolyl cis-trans isomerase SurA